jgi:hypothetical protein
MTDQHEPQPDETPEAGVETPVEAMEGTADPAPSADLADSLESVRTTEGGSPAEQAASHAATSEPEAASTPEPSADAPAEPASEAPAQAEAEASTPGEDTHPEAEVAAESTTESGSAEAAEPAQPAEAGEPAEAAGTSEPAAPATPPVPKPSALPRPSAIPTPAAIAKVAGHAPAPAPPVPVPTDHSASAAFGRVDDTGTVFVRTKEGEQEVGSYPGATPEEALAYFARKYDELYASAVLLEQRLAQPEVPSKDVADGLKTLTAQVKEATVVGDLEDLATKLDEIQSGIAQKRTVEQQHRAEARAQATAEREKIVAEAESIAAQPESRIQWRSSGARMRELLEEWKAHQRAATRLDRETETALWQRFSTARNGFDKARRAHFAQLDSQHSEAKARKERLVDEAERLATSHDWSATAGAFKRLMDEWRRAGRASRADDDRLWARFKAAQDAFFAAKDEVAAAEEEQFRGNLAVKEALLVEAEAILPVTDLDQAKAQLRVIQDRWDAAGKVPRADMDRVEKAMRRVEQSVRDAEDRRWRSTNPEVAARAQGMVDQLERAVADLREELARAERSGSESKIRKAREALEARQAWLDQARAGVAEFGG